MARLEAQSVSINTDGTDAHPSAILDVKSDSKGLLVPRMTTAQREAISTPAEGLLVYDLETSSFWYRQDSSWVDLDEVNRVFENVDGTVRKTGQHFTDDFVFGSSQIGASLFSWENGRMLFYKDKRAFRAGSPRDTFDFDIGIVDGNAADWDPDSLGYYSFASGFGVRASGDIGSAALGREVVVTGDHGSFGAGQYNIVSGSSGSAAIGNAQSVTGDWGAVALGDDNSVSGDNGAMAIGYGNSVTGQHGTVALGYENTVSGDNGAIALGRYTTSSANSAIAMGSGPSSGGPMNNAVAHSLMVGFNSNLPTLFVGPGSGLNTIGQVGIGTTSPGAMLDVDGSVRVDGTTFNVDDALNRVGIGTTTPEAALHIDNGNLLITRGFLNNGVQRSITVKGARGSMNQEYASLEFSNYDNTGFPTEETTAKISSTNADGLGNADLRFFTYQTPVLLQRMIITDFGNVGIGTANPVERLQVSGGDFRVDRGSTGSGLTRELTINGARNGTGNPYASIDMNNFDNNDGVAEYTGARISSENATGSDSGDLRFSTRNSTLTERMIITEDGDIGINTSSPEELLHIDGGNILAGRAGEVSGVTRTIRLNGARSLGGTYYSALQFSNYDDDTSPQDLVRAMISSWNPDGSGNGDLRFHTNDGTLTERMRIEGGGNVGFGNINPSHPLEMASGAHVTAAGAWTNASDISRKTTIRPQPYGLEEIMRMRPKSYAYLTDGSASIGFIAQEMEQIIPEVVSGEEGGKGIAYGLLVSTLVNAMQEQQAQIDRQKDEIARQAKEIAQLQLLEMRLAVLESQITKFARQE